MPRTECPKQTRLTETLLKTSTSRMANNHLQLSLFTENISEAGHTPIHDIAPPQTLDITDYKLLRSRRKTLALAVKNGVLEIRAPLKAPRRWIDEVVEQKKEWIKKQITTQVKQRSEIFRVIDQATFNLLSENYHTIHYCKPGSIHSIRKRISEKSATIVEENECLYFHFPLSASQTALTSASGKTTSLDINTRLVRERLATAAFKHWLTKKAKSTLPERIRGIYDSMALKPSLRTRKLSATTFRITKSKWGHCTSDGVVQINPMLMLAPANVCDYVITHELCHLRHRNHSAHFWQLVEKHCPDWKEAEDWLDTRGHYLSLGSLLSEAEPPEKNS